MPGDVAQAQAGTGSGAADTTLRIAPLHPAFAARAEGLDLRQPLNAAEVAAISAAMDRYAVLVFPGQRFDDDQQLAFGRQFGEVEDVPTLVDQDRRRLATTASTTSPTSARTARSCPRMTVGGCTTSATCCGTATAASSRCRRTIRCCMPA